PVLPNTGPALRDLDSVWAAALRRVDGEAGILDELTKSVAKVVYICDFWCTIHQLAKHQIPRRKHQTPSSREIPSFKFQKVHQPRSPEFGVWKLELLWDLELATRGKYPHAPNIELSDCR